MNLTLPDLSFVRSLDVKNLDPAFGARLADTLEQVQNALNNMGQQTNATAVGETAAPPEISRLTVTQANGIFEFQIFDNNPARRGLEYFIEYSATAAFDQPVVMHLGATRNYRANFGNQTLYFRAYSSYPTSSASAPVYFGTSISPTAVVGAGGVAGPALLASAGSGTASSDGTQGGAGYGRQSTRTALR